MGGVGLRVKNGWCRIKSEELRVGVKGGIRNKLLLLLLHHVHVVIFQFSHQTLYLNLVLGLCQAGIMKAWEYGSNSQFQIYSVISNKYRIRQYDQLGVGWLTSIFLHQQTYRQTRPCMDAGVAHLKRICSQFIQTCKHLKPWSILNAFLLWQ